MKVFTNNSFLGHWPTGSAAVVVAESKEEAANALCNTLIGMGLAQPVKPDDMIEVDASQPSVIILHDGEY